MATLQELVRDGMIGWVGNDNMFAQRIHRFATMRVSPEEQLEGTGFEAINIDLIEEDAYHQSGKFDIYDKFITMLETNQERFGKAYDHYDAVNEKKHRKDFIAMLAAQVVFQPRMATLLHLTSTALSNRHHLALWVSPVLSLLMSVMGATTHRQTKAALQVLSKLVARRFSRAKSCIFR